MSNSLMAQSTAGRKQACSPGSWGEVASAEFALSPAVLRLPCRFPARMLVLPVMFKCDLWENTLRVCYT